MSGSGSLSFDLSRRLCIGLDFVREKERASKRKSSHQLWTTDSLRSDLSLALDLVLRYR